MRAALLTGVASVLMVGTALAGPLERPAGFPTVSAGPAIPSAFARPTFGTPFHGYGGYRIGKDGQFHGYGVFARTARTSPRSGAPGPSARLDRGFALTPPTPSPVAAQGEVLASSILANQYAPAYGVLNIGYPGY